MIKDYSLLLENLLGRRYDEALRESIVSDAFEEYEYPDSIRYTLESMEEIEPSYAYKTFHLAKRIQDKISKEFEKREVHVDFRYQGPIQTETHVVLYGGVELIVLAYPKKGQKPWKAVYQIAQELMDVLTKEGGYKEVNYSSKHKIKLTTLKPTCEITLLPAIWLDNAKFRTTKREIDRGICEYNLNQKTMRRYLPFLNIARINARDGKCNGGLKRMARLLRTLQRDAHDSIDLNNYEVCSMLYGIPEKQLMFDSKKSLSLLGVVSAQLNRILTDKNYREQLISPSEKELVFGKKEFKEAEVQKLKAELDDLIADLQEDLKQEDKNLYGEIAYY